MPKASKSKVGGDKKPIHPNSRKAQYLSRQKFRDMKINKSKAARSKLDLLGDKCAWFRDYLDEDKIVYSKEDLYDITLRYLQRFEEELEQIDIISKVGVRQGQQHASRLAAIKLSMDTEKRDFESCGIQVPDLANKSTFSDFKEWTGELKFVQNFRMKTISRDDVLKLEAKNASIEQDDDKETVQTIDEDSD